MATGICPWCGKEVDKFIMFRGDIVGCRYCGIHTKQTNADLFRSMSDEELADKFEEVQIQAARAYGNDTLLLKGELRKFWLDWLRQEVNQNEGSDNLNA